MRDTIRIVTNHSWQRCCKLRRLGTLDVVSEMMWQQKHVFAVKPVFTRVFFGTRSSSRELPRISYNIADRTRKDTSQRQRSTTSHTHTRRALPLSLPPRTETRRTEQLWLSSETPRFHIKRHKAQHVSPLVTQCCTKMLRMISGSSLQLFGVVEQGAINKIYWPQNGEIIYRVILYFKILCVWRGDDGMGECTHNHNSFLTRFVTWMILLPADSVVIIKFLDA